ncbi:hypothetical protein FZCC0069_05915 [Rhodobacterales bacterium FZCC0069]|nr:hypothetical protein [Rhodobacterales bacterium FZCC0069]
MKHLRGSRITQTMSDRAGRICPPATHYGPISGVWQDFLIYGNPCVSSGQQHLGMGFGLELWSRPAKPVRVNARTSTPAALF